MCLKKLAARVATQNQYGLFSFHYRRKNMLMHLKHSLFCVFLPYLSDTRLQSGNSYRKSEVISIKISPPRKSGYVAV